VATTLYAGVLAARKNLVAPVGSLTQLGRLDVGDDKPMIKDVLPLASLNDIVFGAWDPYGISAYEAAVEAKVLSHKDMLAVQDELKAIRPMSAVLDRDWVKKVEGNGNVKNVKTKWDAALALMDDIASFKEKNKLDRMVMVWTASTEAYRPLQAVHQSVSAFEKGLRENDPNISPSQIYAYAAIKSRVPFANGTPSLTVDVPAMRELAMEQKVPLCGKDFKTGQTLLKTILAPGFKSRMLGVRGWFSTNILGNRDGEVLDDPESFKSKEISKREVLDSILEPDRYPDLYAGHYHKVRIEYYPPRGDDKEAWDNIDIFGWMGYPMQIKVDFLCKDSILAAPLALDLALFMDLAHRKGQRGTQTWLNFYFKAPMVDEGKPENDLFKQHEKLNAVLKSWIEK
jgi:myo-inositol-1-phosphate synthase